MPSALVIAPNNNAALQQRGVESVVALLRGSRGPLILQWLALGGSLYVLEQSNKMRIVYETTEDGHFIDIQPSALAQLTRLVTEEDGETESETSSETTSVDSSGDEEEHNEGEEEDSAAGAESESRSEDSETDADGEADGDADADADGEAEASDESDDVSSAEGTEGDAESDRDDSARKRVRVGLPPGPRQTTVLTPGSFGL